MLSKVDYVLHMGTTCMLAFIGGPETWILGLPLLRKYYIVFDAEEHQQRIGFGVAR